MSTRITEAAEVLQGFPAGHEITFEDALANASRRFPSWPKAERVKLANRAMAVLDAGSEPVERSPDGVRILPRKSPDDRAEFEEPIDVVDTPIGKFTVLPVFGKPHRARVVVTREVPRNKVDGTVFEIGFILRELFPA